MEETKAVKEEEELGERTRTAPEQADPPGRPWERAGKKSR